MPKPKRPPVKKKAPFPLWAGALVAVVLVAVIGYIIYQQINAPKPQLPDVVSVSAAAQLRNQGAFLLDVRRQDEWDAFHIPGATLVTLDDLPNRLSEVPKDKKIVVYCRTGVRSAKGRDLLRQAGYPQVTSLDGGITAWQAQGQQVTTGS